MRLKEFTIFLRGFRNSRNAGMPLSHDQLAAFRQGGFLLVSGLIKRDRAQRAYDRLVETTLNPKRASKHQFVRDPLVRACFTRDMTVAAQQLAGPDVRVRRPHVVYMIAVFPNHVAWQWPKPHIDHSLEKDAHKTLPPAFRIGCLIYLNEVAPRSGGTVVWPGSHVQIEELAAGHRERYEYLAKLNDDLGKLVFRHPIEITAAAGDVLFYNHLLAHSGSENIGTKPRIALNHKW